MVITRSFSAGVNRNKQLKRNMDIRKEITVFTALRSNKDNKVHPRPDKASPMAWSAFHEAAESTYSKSSGQQQFSPQAKSKILVRKGYCELIPTWHCEFSCSTPSGMCKMVPTLAT